MEKQRLKIGVISLGCDKNRVDTEKMLYLVSKEYDITTDVETADAIIINTCAFIESARREGIEEILCATALKQSANIKKVIVTGCLSQRFTDELVVNLPEVDGFLGVSDYDKILDTLKRVFDGERVIEVGNPRGECGTDRILTTDGYAYLKIAEGCSKHCTYCLIPSIRGAFRSIPKEDLIKEAKSLGLVNELILVAQDVTEYGKDLTPSSSLSDLIRALSALDNIKGIRLLYCYPEGITDELIREFYGNAKMIRYLDMPLQHADERVLKLMNRKGTGIQYLALIERLKREVPGIEIRSTFITGFPGECQSAFENLIDFIERAKLFNAGFFKYSEEDTPSKLLPNKVPAGEKTKRLKKLYSAQKKVVKANLKGLVGKIFKVCVQGFDQEQLVYYGRAYFNAPDVDGKVYFFASSPIERGEYVNVKILKASGYDLYGEMI